MVGLKGWNELTEAQKIERLAELKSFLNEEMEKHKQWLLDAITLHRDQVDEFLLLHGRLPLMGEIEYKL